MKRTKWILLGFVVLVALGLTLPTGCAKKQAEKQAETQQMEESEKAVPEVELPAVVLEAIETNVPDAEIGSVEVAEEEGVTLYDIEFKEDRGEIELVEDGTVIDVVTIVTMEELPEAAARAIKDAAEGMTISRLEKSEVRSEIKREEGKVAVVTLDAYRYVYEAELVTDDQTGEIAVDAEGQIVEPLKWDTD
jgi:uncharacterized membrane protein YkoI